MEHNHEVFNLQLAVQQLETELNLYRNGTNASDLLGIISEKDAEIDTLKSNLADTTDKLRKIAKGSQEVLAKCTLLQSEKADALSELEELHQACKDAQAKAEQKQQQITSLESEHDILKLLSSKNELTIQNLEEQLNDRNENIVKLQARCAQLLNEKLEKAKQLEKEKQDKSKQVAEFREELEKAIRINTEIKQKLTQEHAAGFETKIKLKEAAAEFSALQKSSQSTISRLESELRAAIDLHRQQTESKTQMLAEAAARLEETIATAAHTQLDLDVKLNAELEKVTALTLKLQTAERDLLEREAKLNEQQQAILRFESEKDKFVVHKKEIDVLNLKLRSYEDKIKRQEQYMKSRLLKDRSNICSGMTAEASKCATGSIL